MFKQSHNRKLACLTAACAAITFGTIAHAATILIVTDNTGNEASYKTFLESATGGSHTVTVSTNFSGALDATKKATLTSYDLVIVSRNTNSTNYNHATDWNSLEVPLLLHNAALSRSSRWQWVNADWNSTATNAETFYVQQASHPVYDGVTIGSATNTDGTASFMTTGGTVNRQVNGSTNGIVLGRRTDSTTGDIYMADFTSVDSIFYTGTTQTPADRRFFLALPEGAFNPTTGLTSDGQTILANAVAYTVIPEPGSLALLGLGSLMILGRRRTA